MWQTSLSPCCPQCAEACSWNTSTWQSPNENAGLWLPTLSSYITIILHSFQLQTCKAKVALPHDLSLRPFCIREKHWHIHFKNWATSYSFPPQSLARLDSIISGNYENEPNRIRFQSLVLSCWNCLGRIRRSGHGGHVSVRAGFEVPKPIPGCFSGSGLWMEMWALSWCSSHLLPCRNHESDSTRYKSPWSRCFVRAWDKLLKQWGWSLYLSSLGYFWLLSINFFVCIVQWSHQGKREETKQRSKKSKEECSQALGSSAQIQT